MPTETPTGGRGAALVELPSSAVVSASPEATFDVITDLGGQDRWLTRSSAYKGTVDVSSNPARLGTTYLEPGPAGTRHGEVTVFERPRRIVFEQPMTLKAGLGTLGVTVTYELTPEGNATGVRRTCTLVIPRHLRLVRGPMARAFRGESARTLAALEARLA